VFKRFLYYLIFQDCLHEGPVVTKGFVAPEEKQNHDVVPIRGKWQIRKCNFCGGLFAGPKDLLDPNAVPPANFEFSIYKSQTQKGVVNVQD
jgi:hypothetical protein